MTKQVGLFLRLHNSSSVSGADVLMGVATVLLLDMTSHACTRTVRHTGDWSQSDLYSICHWTPSELNDLNKELGRSTWEKEALLGLFMSWLIIRSFRSSRNPNQSILFITSCKKMCLLINAGPGQSANCVCVCLSWCSLTCRRVDRCMYAWTSPVQPRRSRQSPPPLSVFVFVVIGAHTSPY